MSTLSESKAFNYYVKEVLAPESLATTLPVESGVDLENLYGDYASVKTGDANLEVDSSYCCLY